MLKKSVIIASLLTLLVVPTQADILQRASFNTIHHFAVGFSDTFQKLTGNDIKTNFKNDQDNMALLSVGFSSLHHSPQDVTFDRQEAEGTKEYKVLGQALVYPNPFRQEVGAELGYKLTDNMDIEIHVYDMLANLAANKMFKAGSTGGKLGYNKVGFDLETFDGYELSAGVYFYLIIHEGSVLAKGKMAVIP